MDEQAPARETAGPLADDARAVLDAARATAQAHIGGLDALRRLFAAEFGLARDALVAALVWLLVATVLLGTAYLLLTALLVSGLRAAGAPWPLAIAIPLVVSVGVAVFGVLRARAMLRLADFEGTRRQLRLGFGGGSAETPVNPTQPGAAP
ncbi:hypothetical protein [Arenimonas sp.]|uniref:hypothetical protein n=1 Tax=Arenimonas sp. TaxID=1872635 RepID=UPI002E377FDD|nr:hypothetical protein [Arenimonas sp.]HEX4853405.1 hypothetical protein [Arenimonas sp.]